jgi:cell division control protein 24
MLRQRLAEVPGFEQHLNDLDEEDDEDDASDPVSSMWRCLRKGFPLMTIYNTLKPEPLLEIDQATVAPAKRPKIAAFKFVQACLRDLQFPPDECFVIMDLFGDDTTGFVKVSAVTKSHRDRWHQHNPVIFMNHM